MCFDITNHSLLNHGSWLYQRSVRSAASSTGSVKRIQQVTQLIIVKKSYQLKAQLLKMSYYQPNYYFGQNPITSQSGYQWQVSQQQEHAGRPNDGPHPTSQAFPVNGYDMNEDSDTSVSDTVEPVLVQHYIPTPTRLDEQVAGVGDQWHTSKTL